jgi:DNA-binding transcriptional LysR family regulator
MDRLRHIEVFLAVVEAHGFAAAGRRLGLSPPAVTRAIAALEARLGVRLITRTTRRLALTEAGRRLVESGRRVLADLDEAEAAARGEAAAPSGTLALTGPVTFGRMHLTPVVADFLRAAPGVSARLMLADRIVDLIEEGLDAGLRIGVLPDSSLIARRIGEVQRVLVAAPGYLARCGVPRRPAELAAHDMVAFTGLTPGLAWRWGERRGEAVTFTPRLAVNDAAAAIEAAERGEGIAPAFCYQAAPGIAAGRLVPVLDDFPPPHVPVHLVHPGGRHVPLRVRAFLDFAAAPLAERLLHYGRAVAMLPGRRPLRRAR